MKFYDGKEPITNKQLLKLADSAWSDEAAKILPAHLQFQLRQLDAATVGSVPHFAAHRKNCGIKMWDRGIKT